MRKIVLCCLAVLLTFSMVSAQEVVVTGFPLGVGRSIEKDFFKPYYDDLKNIADTLKKYPLAEVVITGGADGETFQVHDNTRNPALALGRAHVLMNFLKSEFNVNPLQIIINSEEVQVKGPESRYASVRISRELADRVRIIEDKQDLTPILARLEQLEQRPPVEKQITEVQPVSEISDFFGIKIMGGLTSSPYGGLPFVGAGMTWKKEIFVEAVAGYSLWSTDYDHPTLDLDTKRRMLGAKAVYFPFDDTRLGILAGWYRIENIANDYLEYVDMSEGPLVGLRYEFFDFIEVTGAYNPVTQRNAVNQTSDTKDGQFMLSLSCFNIFGGKK